MMAGTDKKPRRFALRLFLLTKLPAAFFSGVRVESVNETSAVTSIRYGWFNKNPFRSTYFACLGMAAEFSTGILAWSRVRSQSVKMSMLVTKVEGEFYKKAIGKTIFVCNDGVLLTEAIDRAAKGNNPEMITAMAEGRNEAGETVSTFKITWSFRAKPQQARILDNA